MKRIRATLLTLALAAVAISPLAVASSASAHGWVTDPPSRQDLCSTGATPFECGQVQYEPQSVEAPKGSLLCSGGNERFAILDDETRAWPRTTIDSTTTIQWNLTAAHNTSTWQYFVDGQHFATFDQYGEQPPSNISHTLENLPSGEHTILARWNVSNTVNAFYSCMDVTVGTGGPTDPTDPPTDPTDPPVDTCVTDAWASTSVYTGGDVVTHEGHTWKASWWTRGETPGTTGQWGVWKDQGLCS